MIITKKDIKELYYVLDLMSDLESEGLNWPKGSLRVMKDLYDRLRSSSLYGLKRRVDFQFSKEDIENVWRLVVDYSDIYAGNLEHIKTPRIGLAKGWLKNIIGKLSEIVSLSIIEYLFVGKIKKDATPKVAVLVIPDPHGHGKLGLNIKFTRGSSNLDTYQVILQFKNSVAPYLYIYRTSVGAEQTSAKHPLIDGDNQSLSFLEMCEVLRSEHIFGSLVH